MTVDKKKSRRHRKNQDRITSWELPEGIFFVARASNHPKSQTHRWMAFVDNRVIGYFRTQDEAIEARNKKIKESESE